MTKQKDKAKQLTGKPNMVVKVFTDLGYRIDQFDHVQQYFVFVSFVLCFLIRQYHLELGSRGMKTIWSSLHSNTKKIKATSSPTSCKPLECANSLLSCVPPEVFMNQQPWSTITSFQTWSEEELHLDPRPNILSNTQIGIYVTSTRICILGEEANCGENKKSGGGSYIGKPGYDLVI